MEYLVRRFRSFPHNEHKSSATCEQYDGGSYDDRQQVAAAITAAGTHAAASASAAS